jgi:hypothetical protein
VPIVGQIGFAVVAPEGVITATVIAPGLGHIIDIVAVIAGEVTAVSAGVVTVLAVPLLIVLTPSHIVRVVGGGIRAVATLVSDYFYLFFIHNLSPLG